MKPAYRALVALLVVSSGCLGGVPGLQESGDYDLSVKDVKVEANDDGVLFRGTVTLSGSLGSGAIVNDVRVVFLDEDEEQLASVNVGTLSTGSLADSDPRSTVNFTTRLEKRPKILLIETGNVRTETEVEIYGIRLGDAGEIEYFLSESKE